MNVVLKELTPEGVSLALAPPQEKILAVFKACLEFALTSQVFLHKTEDLRRLGINAEIIAAHAEGMEVAFAGGHTVQLVPAHYCHSPGNFTLYDPAAKILFSGDMGAALLPADYDSMFVEDVNDHVQYMETFHRRWMPSNRAKNHWISLVRALDVEMLCPQHGAIFRGAQVHAFLDWLEDLQVGSGITQSAA